MMERKQLKINIQNPHSVWESKSEQGPFSTKMEKKTQEGQDFTFLQSLIYDVNKVKL